MPIKTISPWEVIANDNDPQSLRRQMLEYQRKLIEKWQWLIEGDEEKGRLDVPKSYHGALAMLFENQVWYNMAVAEDTLKTDVALPIRYALPLIRKVFPRLLIMKIAAVQPMPHTSGGVAQAFFLDFRRVTPDESFTTLKSDWAYNAEKGIPKLAKLAITSENVTATKDILAATWSTEVMEDARGALNFDVEQELLKAMADEIGRELDSRCLNEILTGASAGNVNWSSTVPAGYTAPEWYETLGHAFVDAEKLIYATRYQNANYCVCGTDLYGYVAKMRTFKSKHTGGPADSAGMVPDTLGAEYVGKMQGIWDIWRSPYITAAKGIVGRYPTSWIDSGYIFMPYVPLMRMPLIYAEMDETTGVYENKDAWTRNIRTRNGKYMAVPALFATLTVT